MEWSNSMPVNPQLFVLFTSIVTLACFLAMPLIYLLLGSEDADMQRQQTYNAEDFDGWHIIKPRKWTIWPLVWIAFFVFSFWIGFRHY